MGWGIQSKRALAYYRPFEFGGRKYGGEQKKKTTNLQNKPTTKKKQWRIEK